MHCKLFPLLFLCVALAAEEDAQVSIWHEPVIEWQQDAAPIAEDENELPVATKSELNSQSTSEPLEQSGQPKAAEFPCPEKYQSRLFFEGKFAYFYPTDQTFRKIYGGGVQYTFQTTYHLWQFLYGFASASYFSKSGHTSGFHTPTNVKIIPIGLGLKLLYPSETWIKGYVGLGILPTYVNIHAQSPYVAHVTTGWGCGGIAKAGALFFVTKWLFIDAFIDYAFLDHVKTSRSTDLNISRHSATVSGVSGGAGIGFNF